MKDSVNTAGPSSPEQPQDWQVGCREGCSSVTVMLLGLKGQVTGVASPPAVPESRFGALSSGFILFWTTGLNRIIQLLSGYKTELNFLQRKNDWWSWEERSSKLWVQIGGLPVHLQMNKFCHILRQNTLVGDILLSVYELVIQFY